MKYDGLYRDYWTKQVARVEDLRKKISERGTTPAGRLFPDLEDLVIGTGRRLDATIMFTDICGFTGRTSLTAEQQEMLLRVLNLYFTEMIKIITDYGGTVEKNTGDGIMAYFEDHSAGTAGENSTQRTLACAMTMQAANLELISPILRASGTTPIQYRTTIEHGPITIARLGPPRAFNAIVAIGNAANFANKMLRWVGPDQIALGLAACNRIPISWRREFATLAPASTGWTYGTPPQPYPIYLYSGRWKTLL